MLNTEAIEVEQQNASTGENKDINKLVHLYDQFPHVALMAGDAQYSSDSVTRSETDFAFQKELTQHYQGLTVGPDEKSRIFFENWRQFFKKDYEVTVQTKSNTPIKYLKSMSDTRKIVKEASHRA